MLVARASECKYGSDAHVRVAPQSVFTTSYPATHRWPEIGSIVARMRPRVVVPAQRLADLPEDAAMNLRFPAAAARLTALAAVAALLAGCATTARYDDDYYSDGRYYGDTERIYTMPPPRVEYRGYAPYPNYIWMDGYWNTIGSRYDWVPGYWAPPGTRYHERRWRDERERERAREREREREKAERDRAKERDRIARDRERERADERERERRRQEARDRERGRSDPPGFIPDPDQRRDFERRRDNERRDFERRELERRDNERRLNRDPDRSRIDPPRREIGAPLPRIRPVETVPTRVAPPARDAARNDSGNRSFRGDRPVFGGGGGGDRSGFGGGDGGAGGSLGGSEGRN